jgi:TRAP-type mannitol/chloroaromatic compound transport system substrate-binding protein
MISGLSPTEQLHWYLVGGGKELAKEYFEAGTNVFILGVPSQIRPAETFIWTSKPIRTVDDLKGLKFRTGGDDGKIFTKLGASVMMVAPGEIYESMQRGILDAFQLSSPSTDKSFAAHEVADYAYLSPVRQPGELAIMQIHKDRWAELPDDLKLIFEAESLAASIWHYTKTCKEDIEVIEFYNDYGTTVEPASQEVVDEIAREAVILYDEMSAGDPFYKRVVDSVREFQSAYRDTWPRL